MIVSIMQPYLFPYIGYFQLIRESDVFVLHDDIQYVKNGWVNRNRILVNCAPSMITFPVRSESHRLSINERRYDLEAKTMSRILRRIEAAYRKAPHFDSVFPLVEHIMRFDEPNVAAFNMNSLQRIADQLAITTPFVISSALEIDHSLRGQRRVISLCEALSATQYINLIGGVELYRGDDFASHQITLSFLEARPTAYPQFACEFVPYLSIIDVMMFNDRDRIVELLGDFQLRDGAKMRARTDN